MCVCVSKIEGTHFLLSIVWSLSFFFFSEKHFLVENTVFKSDINVCENRFSRIRMIFIGWHCLHTCRIIPVHNVLLHFSQTNIMYVFDKWIRHLFFALDHCSTHWRFFGLHAISYIVISSWGKQLSWEVNVLFYF